MTSSICAIITTYNRADMLRECIDSILCQTRQPDKIIVVDDGSTDHTEEVVKSYGNRLTFLSKENGGKSSALNLGLVNCEADYIWICDDDDIAAPDGLEQLAHVLDAKADVDFVMGAYKMFYGAFAEQIYVDPPLKVRARETNIKVLFLEDMFTCQFAMLVRKSVYQKVGPFNENMIRSQDYEMSIRLSRSGRGARISNIIFFQRQHAGTRGSAKDSFAADNSFQKWMTYDQKIFNALHDVITLADCTPSFASSWDAERATRAALIEKGSVFARRGLWHYAIEDFRSAIITSEEPLSPEEIEILETVTGFEPAWYILLNDPGKARQLWDIYRINRTGRQAMVAMCRPLIWYARSSFQNKRYKNGFQMMRLLYQILGMGGMVSRISQSFIG